LTDPYCPDCRDALAAAPALKRPGLVTLLAVMYGLTAVFNLSIASWGASALSKGRGPDTGAILFVTLLFGVGGALQAACAIGLWRLKPYGRRIALVFSYIGLIGIPIGTLISVFVLLYLRKPGLRLLFSGRDLTPAELETAAAASTSSAAVVALAVVLVGLVGVVVLGIVAAIAIPGLMRARMMSNQAHAIGTLRAINAAQADYAARCARGAYAGTLDELGRIPPGRSEPFARLDLRDDRSDGYHITLQGEPSNDATPSCTGAIPASAYIATAEPERRGATGVRYFATDQRGIVFWSDAPIASPIVESDEVHRVE
jgi:type II secretory pathway pseudopilin PulG